MHKEISRSGRKDARKAFDQLVFMPDRPAFLLGFVFGPVSQLLLGDVDSDNKMEGNISLVELLWRGARLQCDL